LGLNTPLSIGEKMNLADILKARLPLIGVTTDDKLNIVTILEHLISTKKKKQRFVKIPANTTPDKIALLLKDAKLGVILNPEEDFDWDSLYTALSNNDSMVVVVNQKESHPLIYDYGWVSTPVDLIKTKLQELIVDTELADDFTPILKELSLKQVEDVLRLSTSIYGHVSEATLNSIKKEYTKLTTGIHAIDTNLRFYYPIDDIENWLDDQGHIIHKDVPKELKPRGLLFLGDAGTGKTFSAKRIAIYLELPLYRLDLSSMKSKYHGESETNLDKALKQLDTLSPCVLLIDEVEKLFNSYDDSNVSSNLLSQMLWWLNEHTLDVLTIMTTNNKDIIPTELYRPGRVNSEITFKPMSLKNSHDFVSKLITNYMHLVTDMASVMLEIMQAMEALSSHELTYAKLTEVVFSAIRKQLK
jgi:hypothetical protein